MVESDSDSSDSSELNSSSMAEVLVYVPLYAACTSGPDFDILVPGRLTLWGKERSNAYKY